MSTTQDLLKTLDQLGKYISAGKLTAGQLRNILSLVGISREVLETHGLNERVRALEQSLGQDKAT